MVYHFKIHKEGKGYWAECIELDGCQTQAKTLPELKKNISEVINLFLSEPEDSKVLIPLPRKSLKGRSIVEAHVDPQVAFAMRLRQIRLKNGYTQKEAAHLLNIKTLFTYQKLEKSATANPELKTLVRIKKVFPDFDVDEIIED